MTLTVRPADLIRKYYSGQPKAWQILLDHSRQVTMRAINIARFLGRTETIDLQFVAEAAMLHDIGMVQTNTPDLSCYGTGSYLQHGIAGRKILENEGLPKHALVCERHIGIGLTAEEIKNKKLPLPQRDMLPISLEEQIICYADLFYSKGKNNLGKEKSAADVCRSLSRFGGEKIAVFEHWQQLFEPEVS